MVNTLSLRRFLVIWIFISLIQENLTEQPLIINPNTFEIYNLEDGTSNTYKDENYIVACPAETQHEYHIMMKQSPNCKSLFARQYPYQQYKLSNPVKCNKNFELSISYYGAHMVRWKAILFGYQIFYDKSKLKVYNKGSYNYRKFRRVTNRYTFFYLPRNFSTTMEDPVREDVLVYTMSFLWIPKASIFYDKALGIVNKLTYTIGKKAEKPSIKCDDHNLDEDIYKWHSKKNLDDYYEIKNQMKILKGVQLGYLPKGSLCKSTHNCLKKFDIVPPYQFQRTNSDPVSCPNVTTIPIWYETTEALLDYLDKFLFAIVQVSHENLIIYTKFHEVLTLSKEKNGKFQKIYLDHDKKKIPVPKIIIKIIRYKMQYCDAKYFECWYQTIIVIHNEPNVSGKLCKDICAELGWESIQYMSTVKRESKSHHIYCCKLNETFEKILNFKAANKLSYLNLEYFPTSYINKRSDSKNYENKKQAFEMKMNQIYGLES